MGTEEDFDRIIEDKKQRIKNVEDELVRLCTQCWIDMG